MEQVSRQKAKSLDLKRFFTGVPCVRGHISERYVANGQCVSCRSEKYDPDWQRQYNQDYRAENLTQIRAKDAARYAANIEERRAASRRYHANKSEERRLADKARRLKNAGRYYANRKSAVAASSARSDKLRDQWRSYYRRNSEKIRQRASSWKNENPDRARANNARRRAGKRNAVPPWSGELDTLVWLEAADLVRLRFVATGVAWHADHMIPLACRKASGLHAWNNCQVIPAALNNWKKNKLLLTEPGQWISHLHQNF